MTNINENGTAIVTEIDPVVEAEIKQTYTEEILCRMRSCIEWIIYDNKKYVNVMFSLTEDNEIDFEFYK